MTERQSEPLDRFVAELERSLLERFNLCNDAAVTPSTILLAVLNAVVDARVAMEARP